uniref:IRS-type PTB domain-containing protein n=1 Tax=Romanomermis culicivorax TaxID=13658 RepID=A0A915HQR1_ROMCU
MPPAAKEFADHGSFHLRNQLGRDPWLLLEQIDALVAKFCNILTQYYTSRIVRSSGDRRPHHVWDVNAEIKQIEELKDLSGPCRLCLTRRSLYVYKKPFPDIYREFPLVSVSDYGHNDIYFMIKLGRSADTGPGSIFFRADDPDGSKNIHDVLLTITGENHEERLRSSSDSSSRRTSTLSPSGRTGGSTRSMTDRYSTSLVTSSLLPGRTGIIESEKKLKEIRGMFSRDSNSAMVLAGGCSRSSISSLSSSGSLSHPGSHRFSRVGSDCINPLPVVNEGGGSGSGAEYLPIEKHMETKNTTSVEPGYAEMKVAKGPTPTPYQLEEVRSYISDDSFTSAADPLGARAYSLGAKMLPRSSGTDNTGRDDSTSNITGAACLNVEIYKTMEDRKRALSFDSRKHYNRMNTASEKMHDLRLDIDSRCGSLIIHKDNCVDEYPPMDFNNQSTKLSSSPKSYLSSLNRSILPIHVKNVVPIEEEIELVDQTAINTDQRAMSKNPKSADIVTVEPTELRLKNDALHYSTLDIRLSANAAAFKSSPGLTPKQSNATFSNNDNNKEEIVDKIVYTKIQPGNSVVKRLLFKQKLRSIGRRKLMRN